MEIFVHSKTSLGISMVTEVLPFLHFLILEDPCTDTMEGFAELFVYLYLRQFYGRADPSPTREISE